MGSQKVLKKGYDALKKIEKALKNEASDEDESDDDDDVDDSKKKKKRKSRKKSSRQYDSDLIEELSNEYYSLIPHIIGFKRAKPINSEKRWNWLRHCLRSRCPQR